MVKRIFDIRNQLNTIFVDHVLPKIWFRRRIYLLCDLIPEISEAPWYIYHVQLYLPPIPQKRKIEQWFHDDLIV